MNFINLFLSTPQAVTVKNGNLHVKGEGEHTFPLSDIGVVMVENMQCTLSAYAVTKLCESGATLFLCNEKHLPTVQLLPCNTFSRSLKRFQAQISLSKPRQKSLWKQIIKVKIQNQAEALALAHQPHRRLEELCAEVRSGDEGNTEGVAAAYYFPRLFGEGFTRENENAENAALNYAYAVVRGMIARQIAARGLLPCLGIFHHNEYNAFNLADDLIEPFRPIVDRFVYMMRESLVGELTPDNKRALFSVVNLQVLSGGERHALSYAVERFVESVVAYLEGRDALLFPAICGSGTVMHEYE